ncbi:winged helix-turn-helix transcriptional regulator [Nocardia sp. NPDC006044]|uniref:winged helix-turn-helix transcriptional regulator n=1 Tax=Nocardia sp. NPDC006044 TaxID=3364306 RepID=UPI0036C62806
MTTRRSYGDSCAAAHALDLVGERWALLVVRELLLGPKRFRDLRQGMPGLSGNVLSQRLRELEDVGVVRRATLGPPVGSQVYELTDWGRDLEPVLTQLGKWGGRSPLLDRDAPRSIDSVMLSQRARFSPSVAGDLNADIAVRIDNDRFAVRVGEGRLDVERAEISKPDAVIETDLPTFKDVLTHELDVDVAVASNRLQVQGRIELVRRLFDAMLVPATVQ